MKLQLVDLEIHSFVTFDLSEKIGGGPGGQTDAPCKTKGRGDAETCNPGILK